MKNHIKIPSRGWSASGGKNQQSGFLRLIIFIVVVMLLMKYFNITFSDILSYFNLTWAEVMSWPKQALDWLKDLFNSVK